ncbi:hypothetical protein NE237_018747 [Protea cynaroides]|uniref:Uncharacterized protein n=1 Tax=Protea cynaroides TaxID=273540 RepID=A0A9Q0QPB0_9MAGN|nr:hypothetical protein NE237_018747 [Protea cynaroides]
MTVGLQAEFGYARSLACLAANFGPVAWKIASQKIERALPAGLKFGPGWAGQQGALVQRLQCLLVCLARSPEAITLPIDRKFSGTLPDSGQELPLVPGGVPCKPLGAADSVPSDLNVRFQSPGSPSSSLLVDSPQPDLALQL